MPFGSVLRQCCGVGIKEEKAGAERPSCLPTPSRFSQAGQVSASNPPCSTHANDQGSFHASFHMPPVLPRQSGHAWEPPKYAHSSREVLVNDWGDEESSVEKSQQTPS